MDTSTQSLLAGYGAKDIVIGAWRAHHGTKAQLALPMRWRIEGRETAGSSSWQRSRIRMTCSQQTRTSCSDSTLLGWRSGDCSSSEGVNPHCFCETACSVAAALDGGSYPNMTLRAVSDLLRGVRAWFGGFFEGLLQCSTCGRRRRVLFLPLGDRQKEVDVLRLHVSAQRFGDVPLRHVHRPGCRVHRVRGSCFDNVWRVEQQRRQDGHVAAQAA